MNDGGGGNTLSGNTAEGDIAARDINKPTHIHLPNLTHPLRQKVEQLTKDCLHDPEFRNCINQLRHYLNPVSPDEQRDLRTKLTDADRSDDIFEAEESKEKFAKILAKDGLSEKAQEAYAHILSMIKFSYDSKVKPLIIENAVRRDIDDKVFEIVKEIYSALVGTILEYDIVQVKGMLYFLTGNCHIDWKY